MSEEMTGSIAQSKETTESDLYMRDSPVRGRPVNKNKVKVISKMSFMVFSMSIISNLI